MTSHRMPPRQSPGWLLPIVVLLLVVFIWLAWLLVGVQLVHKHLTGLPAPTPSVAELGQVGDLFGGINALFAALACAGVFWAGWLQRQSLIEARQGLHEDRARLERQQFDATFFQLVGLFRSMLQDLRLHRVRGVGLHPELEMTLDSAVDEVVGGRDSEHGFYESMPTTFEVGFHVANYRSVLNPNRSQIEPLFRILATLLAHVEALDESQAADREGYAAITRSLLPAGLVTLFTFNALAFKDAKAKELIMRFRLLDAVADQEYLALLFKHAFEDERPGDDAR